MFIIMTSSCQIQALLKLLVHASLCNIMLAYFYYSLFPVQSVVHFSYSPRCSSVSLPSCGPGCSFT